MGQLSKIVIVLTTILSYFISLFSAIIVFPYLWLPTGILLALLGSFFILQYKYRNRGVLGIALFTNGTFIALGQYLETVIPAISILVNILGAVMTVFMMLVWYYWKEGQRHVQVRIKQEKIEDRKEKKTSVLNKIRYLYSLYKKQKILVKEKGYSRILALQFVYVEYHEERMKREEKNSLDFILGTEVTLQRNEYDQSPDKQK